MKTIQAFNLDAFALMIILFIYLNARKRRSRSRVQHGLFTAMMLTIVLMLAVDAAAWAVNGIPDGYYWNWALNCALYIFTPVAPALWSLYADYQVLHDRKRLKALAMPLAFIVLLNAALTAASLRTGWFFTVSADNVYSRGPLFPVHPMLCYAFLLYTFLFIIKNRKRVDERHYASLLVFALPPAAGGILQCLFYGLSLVWSCMSLSMLLVYFNIQDRRLDTDYLTGVYNRRLLGSHMRERAQSGAAKKTFSAILIDLDNFKEINDTLGHDAGDKALADAAGLLKSCLRQGDFIARYGGDEFLIVLDIADRAVLEETVGRIRESFAKFNESPTRPYRLSFSTGYDIYDMGSGMDPEQFVKRVDKLMYTDKGRGGKAKPAPDA
jgi:diguanylate cyclase (GGDEF)-like protein